MLAQPAVGEATPFINPFNPRPSQNAIGNALYIEPEAKRFFLSLNGYEKDIVAKGIEELRSIKNPLDGASHKFRPWFWKMKKTPGVAGNYLISYEVYSDRVVVTGIRHNTDILGKQTPSRNEHNAMYHIKRVGDTRFTEKLIPRIETLNNLRAAWEASKPVTRIETAHAAVNGMLNDHNKAVWLMGLHTDFAYEEDNCSASHYHHIFCQIIYHTILQI